VDISKWVPFSPFRGSREGSPGAKEISFLRVGLWGLVCLLVIVFVWRIGAMWAGSGSDSTETRGTAAGTGFKPAPTMNVPTVFAKEIPPETRGYSSVQPADANRAAQPSEPNSAGLGRSGVRANIADGNEPNQAGSFFAGMPGRRRGRSAGPSNDAFEALNLKDVEMRFIIEKIAEWTGKVVIPTDEVMKQKLTIYSSGRLSQNEALEHIYAALRLKGFIAEQSDKTIYLRPISDARIGVVPTITPEQSLAAIENKEQIVQKFFKLANSSPTQMVQIVQPLIGEYGHISADDSASSLLVIDTVASLMRIETVISQFDVAESRQVQTEIFEIRHREPEEIVQVLQILLARNIGQSSGAVSVARPAGGGGGRRGGRGGGGQAGAGAATSIISGAGRAPILLVPESKFNWIIAKASPEDMNDITRWIDRLDRSVPTVAAAESLDAIENQNQVVQRFVKLQHYDLARMAEVLQPLMTPTGHVTLEEGSKTLMLIDTVESLRRLESVIAQFDVPQPQDIVTKIFELRYREPAEITSLLDILLNQDGSTIGQATRMRQGRGGGPFRPRTGGGRGASVTAVASGVSGRPMFFIPEPQRKWIIVKASAEDIEQITDWITKLDKPIPTVSTQARLTDIENKNQVVQRFVTLKNGSPSRMVQIINPLLGDGGYVTADETTGNLLLIDTVENLIRVEGIINQFDVPEDVNAVSQIFELRHSTPDAIVSLLETLLAEGSAAGTAPRGGRPTMVMRSRSAGPRSASSVVVGAAGRSVVLIPVPVHNWIIAKGSAEDLTGVGNWIEKLDKAVPTVSAQSSLADIENKNQIVQRFFPLKNVSPSRIAQIVTPLMGDGGSVTADETTRNLLLIDTVENLIRIEGIVNQFDVAEDANSVSQVFEIRHSTPDAIISLLETLLAQAPAGGRGNRPPMVGRPRNASWSRVSTMTVGAAGRSIMLIPEPTHSWIIAKGSPEDIAVVAKWIERLDTAVPTIADDSPLSGIENKNQVVQKFIKLAHYNPTRMGEVIAPLLGENGYLTVDETGGRLLVIDTVENLLRVEGIVTQFDVAESEQTSTQVFELKSRRPSEIIALLETLLTADQDQGAITVRQAGRGTMSRRGGNYRPSTGRGRGGVATPSTLTGTAGKPIVLIPDDTRNWIIAKASPEDIKRIAPWIERLDQSVPTLSGDTPLNTIENKNQIVQKCIKLRNYSPSQMGEIVLPLLGESGYVSADESTGNLLVIDTVENLLRIEPVVAQFDVPEAEQMTTQVFEMRHADPAEVVQLLRMLLSDGNGRSPGSQGRGRGGVLPRTRPSGSGLYRGTSSATSVLFGPSSVPVVLIPEPKRKWIIARASAEDMKLLTEWVAKLDVVEPMAEEYESVVITYADVREVASRLTEALQQMPGTELQASVLVQPLEQARQIMVFGREDLREMVKKLIKEIDVPPGQFETQHFKLKYADPDRVRANIEELYGDAALLSGRSTSTRYPGSRSAGGVSSDTVKVLSHVSLKEVTIIASPENMKKIGDRITEWDVPVDVNEVKPRIVELSNSDPVQMATLLRTLFSEENRGNYSFYDYVFGSSSAQKQRIVGPLYGQLTFEEVPGSKKIIVISNLAEAYNVVEDLIKELDRREAGEVPKVVRLKYADPEVLSERLNAMFNEEGTSATIRLSQRGLSDYSMDEGSTSSPGNNNNRPMTNSTNAQPGAEYRPWWTTGRRSTTEMPISNVIGRVRFIPDTHSKSVLVLSPPEYLDSIESMIRELDIPGRQVMIKAIIIQVDHQNMTSLGLQLSSDKGQWSSSGNENSVVAWNALSQLEKHGALVFGAGNNAGSRSEVTISADIGVLIDFLVRQLDAKILNQQTLWTKDNEEAQFFKGQRVGFQTRVSISDTGGRATSDFTYEKVGMTLRARPSITPEKNVDMIINVILSQLTSEEINQQRVRTELDTTTNMIVQDGQTIMLGGMLFQEDSKIKRKIWLLGDIPLIGGLFQHNNNTAANSELLIFITPAVIDSPEQTSHTAIVEMKKAERKLNDVRQELGPPANDEPEATLDPNDRS
jgi:general secretion pathway protein D